MPQSSPDIAPPHLGPDQLAAWQAFLRTHTALTRVLERELMRSHQLPLATYDVLVQLDSAPGGALRMTQLAEQVMLSRSGLTRLVERIEAEGLVRREACASDARGFFTVITQEGRRRLHEAAPSHLGSVAAHFADPLSVEQTEALRGALERILGSLSESGLEVPPANGGECLT